jgi:ABC-type transport system substrate-binding protein
VDKDRLIQAFYGGTVPASGQPAARMVLGHDPALAPYPYDPDRARRLLADAGFANGFAFTMEAVVGSSGSDGAVYQQIAQDLLAINVRMDVRSVPGLRMGQLFRAGGWSGEAFSFLYGAEPTFDGLRALKYYTCAWQPLMYCDPGAEALLAAADNAVTLPARAAAARRVMARYRDQASALFLFESPRFHGVAKSIRGFRMDHTRIAFEEIVPAGK